MAHATLFHRIPIADLRELGRDAMLRWLIPLPLAIALLVRFMVPMLLEQVSVLIGVDLRVYQPLSQQVGLLIAPALTGMVFGFQLLDLRDDRTLYAIQLTPAGIAGMLRLRLVVATLLAWLNACLATMLIGIGPAGLVLIGAALVAALLAPLIALWLALVAENKVQGLAYTKLLGVLLVAPAGAAVLPAYEWLFLLLPSAWPGWVVRQLEQAGPVGILWFGFLLALELLLIGVLVRRVSAL